MLCDFRVYDRAAIKFRGPDADINFNISDYDEDFKQVVGVDKYLVGMISFHSAEDVIVLSYSFDLDAVEEFDKGRICAYTSSP